MPESLLKRMKDTFLDFDYWLSEKSRFPSFKIMWTENHIITYHCAEYLAAQLFPEEVFRSRGMTGEELKKVAKAQILDWIRIKGRVGFSEWDSNTYVSINLETLMTLYDFAEDPELTAQAEKLLNIIFLSLALNNHKGIYGCTHGRAYSNAIRDESGNPLHCLLSILWDVDDLRPTRCAEKGIAPKDCRCTTYMPRVNKALYRTRDYMLSTAQDFRKGEHGFQQHIWQATLAPRAIVFTNHPGEYTEGGRPDLWSGNNVEEILRRLNRERSGELLLTIEPHLTVFEGLGKLQQEVVRHHEIYPSQREAFHAACEAVRHLLTKVKEA